MPGPAPSVIGDDRFVQAGHEVLLSGSGTHGIELARTRRPDLVLLDLMLPDLPGTEVCRVIKREPSTRGIARLIFAAASRAFVALRS